MGSGGGRREGLEEAAFGGEKGAAIQLSLCSAFLREGGREKGEERGLVKEEERHEPAVLWRGHACYVTLLPQHFFLALL
jgi:hypothetical protein